MITSSSQRSILTTVKSGSSILQKYAVLIAGLAVRIFPATTRTFTKDTALSEHGRRAAWHVCMSAARHGMAGERHGRGMDTAWYL